MPNGNHADDLDLILQIGLQINAEHDLDRLLHLAVEAVKDSLHYPYCAVLLKEGTNLVIRAVTQDPEATIGKRLPLGHGITGRCAASRQEELVTDISQCPYYVHFGDEVFQSELDIPIVFRDRVLGVLNTQSPERDAAA